MARWLTCGKEKINTLKDYISRFMIISLFQVMSGLFHFFMKTMTIKYFITQEIKTTGTKSPDLYYT